MFVVRSILNGIGTGAGVAWPTFGIVASTFYLSSAAVIPLAVFCAVLFCLITGFTALTTYRNSIEAYRQLDQKIQAQAHQLLNNLHELLSSSSQQIANRFDDSLIQHPLVVQSEPIVQAALAQFLSNHHREFSRYPSLSRSAKRMLLNHLLASLASAPASRNITMNEIFDRSFLAFVGAFGSIAGCGAGMMGLLSTVGIVSGFAALPMIGVGLLTAAVAIGAYRADEAAIEAIEGDKRAIIHIGLQQLNCEFLEFNTLQPTDNHQPEVCPEASNDASSEQRNIPGKILQFARFKGTLFNANRRQQIAMATESDDDEYGHRFH